MFLTKYKDQIHATLRIVAGFLFIWHGISKFFGYPDTTGGLTYQVGIAGTIELLGGFLLIIGLFTHWVAFLASGLMAYAYWFVHAPANIFPIINHGEMAALYCFVFLYYAVSGAGIWSFDNYISQRKRVLTI